MNNTPFAELLKARGIKPAHLAHDLGVDKSTVTRWTQRGVPADRVVEVARVTGISRHELRPDLSRIFVEDRPDHGGEAA